MPTRRYHFQERNSTLRWVYLDDWRIGYVRKVHRSERRWKRSGWVAATDEGHLPYDDTVWATAVKAADALLEWLEK
jgi:hypothetical protein